MKTKMSRTEYQKQWRENNKERIKEQKKKYYQQNKNHINEQNKNYYYDNKQETLDSCKEYRTKNKESIAIKKKLYVEKNKEQIKLKKKEHYKKNKEQIKLKKNEYYKKNKETIIEKVKTYKKNKRNTDPLFKVSTNISTLIRISFKRKGYSKKSRTFEILGCTYEEFKAHLESKFEPWMTWDNYGLYNGELNYGWDIDHIIPISSAENEDGVIALNHYTNLQPLCSKVNRDEKRDSYSSKIISNSTSCTSKNSFISVSVN